MKKMNRRRFIAASAKTGIALTAAGLVSNNLFSATLGPGSLYTSFDQSPLPYGYQALEPVIDAMTMEIHYTKHAAGYAKNVKEAALAERWILQNPLKTYWKRCLGIL